MKLAQVERNQQVHTLRSFDKWVEDATGAPLTGMSLDVVQVNIGLRCNLACRHCHVESSPRRGEEMSWDTMMAVLHAAERAGARTLDITGGAPEMHPLFEWFVDEALAIGLEVIVRTNLTILLEPGYETLEEFYADRSLHLVGSLPCYLPENVDKQRGRHVHRESIEAIRRLNAAGYGVRPDKILDLVYNPLGASLPPDERALEDVYRQVLRFEFGICFNNLHAITNVPIGRFRRDLDQSGQIDEYLRLLRESFNPGTLQGLMCRHQLHVGWDGTLYDCDFNFALGLPAAGGMNVRDFDPASHRMRQIATDSHCFACTAGCGSSCGGALTQETASSAESH